MPIKVALQTLKGDKKEEIVPPSAILNRILHFEDPAFPLLGLIDEYGNTLFNSNQMIRLLVEWDALMKRVGHSDDEEVFTRVRAICETCMREPHTFVRFIGD